MYFFEEIIMFRSSRLDDLFDGFSGLRIELGSSSNPVPYTLMDFVLATKGPCCSDVTVEEE